MKTCPNCQSSVNDNECFCPNCGSKVDAQQTPDVNANNNNTQPNCNQQAGGYYPPQQSGNQDINTTPILVWSIINLLFCCMPLGIWSLILSVTLNKKPTRQEAEKNYKTAKIICLVGTICGAIFQIVYIILMVVGAMANSTTY